MVDYSGQPRESMSAQYRETLRGVALRRPEAGHRKVQAYALAWQEMPSGAPGTSRMSCYRQLKAQGLIQRGKPGRHLREIRDRRRQMLEVPTEFNAVLQGDFTDYETEDGERYHIGCFIEYTLALQKIRARQPEGHGDNATGRFVRVGWQTCSI